MQTDKGVGKKN